MIRKLRLPVVLLAAVIALSGCNHWTGRARYRSKSSHHHHHHHHPHCSPLGAAERVAEPRGTRHRIT